MKTAGISQHLYSTTFNLTIPKRCAILMQVKKGNKKGATYKF
jgi:hypothetical protein